MVGMDWGLWALALQAIVRVPYCQQGWRLQTRRGTARRHARGLCNNRPMFHIVLVEPEIPPNTGNIIRLAANTGCTLHLVEPLGFSMDDKLMRRAGLDYHEYAPARRHASWQAFAAQEQPDPQRLFALTTRGSVHVHTRAFNAGDWFVFGSESRGLSSELRERFAPGQRIRLPMRAGQRSLNLSNAVAVTVFEAWRQNGFAGAAAPAAQA